MDAHARALLLSAAPSASACLMVVVMLVVVLGDAVGDDGGCVGTDAGVGVIVAGAGAAGESERSNSRLALQQVKGPSEHHLSTIHLSTI